MVRRALPPHVPAAGRLAAAQACSTHPHPLPTYQHSEKIPGCTSNDARGVELALRRLVARWALEGRVLILKAHAAPLDGRPTDGSIWRSLHAMGARAVVAWRSNSLAYLISSARVCAVARLQP